MMKKFVSLRVAIRLAKDLGAGTDQGPGALGRNGVFTEVKTDGIVTTFWRG